MAKNQFDNDNNDVFADELFDDTDNFEKIQLGEDNLETAPIDDNLTDILDGFAAEADEDEDWLLNNANNHESETLDLDTAVIPDANYVGQPDQEVVTDETMVVDPLKMRAVSESPDEAEFEDAYIATAPIETPHQSTGIFSTEDLPDDEDKYATGPIDTVSGNHDDNDNDIYLDEDDGKKHRKIFWIFIGCLIAVCAIVIAVLGYQAYSKIQEEEALNNATTTTDTTPTTSTTTVKPTERDESTSDYTYTTTDTTDNNTTTYDNTDDDDDDQDTYTDTTETTEPETTQAETTTTTTTTTDTAGDQSAGTTDTTTSNTDHTTNTNTTTDTTAGTEP